MNAKDIIDIIFNYRDDIWQHWMILVTLNIALWGWLIQRKGLFGIAERLIATAGYSAFVLIIISGINKSYINLNLASNELFDYYNRNKVEFSDKGIIKHLITKSPKDYKLKIAATNKIKSYLIKNKDFIFALTSILVGWIFSIILFWSEGLWESSRRAEKTK